MSSFFIVLGYMNATRSAAQVFKYFVDVSTVFGVLNWMNILLAYFGFIRAMRAQKFQRAYMPYRCFCQPYSGMFAFLVSILVIMFSGEPSIFPLRKRCVDKSQATSVLSADSTQSSLLPTTLGSLPTYSSLRSGRSLKARRWLIPRTLL